jgi:hypothetical protein
MSKKKKKQEAKKPELSFFIGEKVLNWQSFDEINFGYLKFHNVSVNRNFSHLKEKDKFLFVLINTNTKLPYIIFVANRHTTMKKFYINDLIIYQLLGNHPKYDKTFRKS